MQMGGEVEMRIDGGGEVGGFTERLPAIERVEKCATRRTDGFYQNRIMRAVNESGFGGEINYTPVAPPPSPTFKPIIVLTVQNTPNLLTPWGTLETVSLSANQKTGVFRMKISTQ